LSVSQKLIFAGLFAAAISLAYSSGCTSDKADAVVELCGNLSVPDDIDSVRVVIYDQDRTPLRQGVRELWTCPGPTLHRFPQTIKFEPAEGEVFIEVQGLKQGAPVMRSELRTTFNADNNTATVSLTQACLGVTCAAGETCVQGECELVALAARAVSSCSLGEPADEPGASVDSGAGTDAGQPDAGQPDAGQPDAGPTQTQPEAYLCPEEEDDDRQDAGPPRDTDDASGSADTGPTDTDSTDTDSTDTDPTDTDEGS
jgi:hypothetical protein